LKVCKLVSIVTTGANLRSYPQLPVACLQQPVNFWRKQSITAAKDGKPVPTVVLGFPKKAGAQQQKENGRGKLHVV
jgi:hypothetical protein